MKKRPDEERYTPFAQPDAEQELIDRARSGDTAAFEQLAAAYSRRIYNIGLRMLNNNEDAADMTQETLLKVFRNLPRFRGESSFSTWVYRISVNTCRDMLRSAYRKRERIFSDFGEEDGEAAEFEIADYSAIPEQAYLEEESRRYLVSLIDGLNPKYRVVTVLREVAGLSYQEIAAAVNISVGTVKSRLNRARAAMSAQARRDAEQYGHLYRLMVQGGQENEVL